MKYKAIIHHVQILLAIQSEYLLEDDLNSNIWSGIEPISNPENLKLSIIKANGGVNHTNGVKANTPSSASLGSLGRSSGGFSSSSSN